ncbi:carbohydrate ABC transporter permease [Cohnella nanjingensis]|uniref:Sugar ABC transporter permease n=1 Tax=Cohnella nanjingensis TaxID=1387779 RepID=A0A7X0RPD4_9BACL|nr:sugar ABC transporter permease [Cohnella nanjingensis]MBB6669784.1 sugar ABC transporter permease [Cohnella nanjingensis]
MTKKVHYVYIYACLFPSFILIGLFMLYPALEAFRMSFLDWNMTNYLHPESVGFDNYIEVFKDAIFRNSFLILLVFMIWHIIILQGASLLGAYFIYLLGNTRLAGFYKVAFTIPMVLPGMVTTMFWLFFYEPNNGMLNTVLSMIGLEHWQHIWLGDNQVTAMGSLMMKGFPWISGLGFLIYLAGFQNIDESLREAATVDGASPWKIFWAIDLKMVAPQIRLTTILVLIGGTQQFSDQLIMTKGGPGYDTMVPGLYMYNNAFTYGKLGVGAAIGVILFVLTMALTYLNLRSTRERG